MRFDALDIISGLEDAYFEVVQLVSNFAGSSLRQKRDSAPARPYSARATKSIMRELRQFYVALNQDRQISWRKYGKPFGLSGWTAFVQYNAPRVAGGYAITRFAPIYVGNLVQNFDMYGNPPANWTHGQGGFFLGNGHVSVAEGDFVSDKIVCYQNLSLLPNTDYEMGFEIHTYGNATGQIKYGLGADLVSYDLGFNYPEGERITHTFHTPSGSGILNLPVIFYTNGDNYMTYINNVSVIEQ